VKGLGNYSFQGGVERKPGVLIMFRGNNAVVRFHNGTTYTLPAAPLRQIGIAEGDHFMLVVVRKGKRVVEVRAEPITKARPRRARQATPRVYRKMGRKVVTRRQK
jgi:hypothetical protein